MVAASIKNILDDVTTVVEGLWAKSAVQDSILQRWTPLKCRSQVTLQLIVGSLSEPRSLKIDGSAERRAVVDVIRHSYIGCVLRFNEDSNCVTVRDDASEAVLNLVKSFIDQKTAGGVE